MTVNRLPRASPTGALLTPAAFALYDASGVVSFQILPAGHIPGLYSVAFSGFIQVQSSAGTVTPVLNWGQPNFGLATFSIGTANIVTGRLLNSSPRNIESDGTLPISMVLTPAAVGTPPLIRLFGGAELITPS